MIRGFFRGFCASILSGAGQRHPAYLLATLFFSALMSPAFAANYTFSGSSFPTCSSGAWQTSGINRTCNGSFSLASGDTILPASGIFILSKAGITLAGGNTVGSSSVAVNLRTEWGNLRANGSGNTIHGNLNALSGEINLAGTTLNGNLTTNGDAILNGGYVSGNVSGQNGVATSNGTVIEGNVLATNGPISLSGGRIGGSVHSVCCKVTTYYTDLENGISSKSNTVEITGGTISAGEISGTISTEGGSGVIIRDATVISGTITTKNVPILISNSTIGSPTSPVNISNNHRVTLENGTVAYGTVTAGNWNGALTIDNTSNVYGNCYTGTTPHLPRCDDTPPVADPVDAGRFDCIETRQANYPESRNPLYTKLAGTDFSFAVVALKADGTIEPNFSTAGGGARSVTVELVEDCASTSSLASQRVTFPGNTWRVATGNFKLESAQKVVRCRVTDASNGTTACLTESFAIRPKEFDVSSNMTNSGLPDYPKKPAGTPFTLTADAGVTAGYDGTPTLEASKVKDHKGNAIATDRLTGSFGAGTGSGASGATFEYRDVGYIQLSKDAVVDSGFMVATNDWTNEECVRGSTSNTPNAEGKYGCDIGSKESETFGRWHPIHYSFSGTLTPSCSATNHTYMGEDKLKVELTVTARVPPRAPPCQPEIEINCENDTVASRYTYDQDNPTSNDWIAAVTFTGDNGGTPVDLTRLADPSFPTMPSQGLWNSGQFKIEETYQFTRAGTRDGPYDQFKIIAAVDDPDGATLITPKDTNTTRVRYGRLVVGNAHGSELIDLPVNLYAQYWDGTWKLNTLDSCSSIDPKAIVFSDWTGKLNACETSFLVSNAVTLSEGKAKPPLTLRRPGADNWGGVLLTLAKEKPPVVPEIRTCSAGTETAILDADVTTPWFGSENVAGRISFGTHKAPLIDRRERY